MEKQFIDEAAQMAIKGIHQNAGGPFGCIIVKNGKIISRGYNQVTSTNDPTAHAEMVAIRQACKSLNSFQLDDCEIYTSCEPCPMCMAAIYWARPSKVYFANTHKDAQSIGFDDQFIYQELSLPIEKRKIEMQHIESVKAKEAFQLWQQKKDKIEY